MEGTGGDGTVTPLAKWRNDFSIAFQYYLDRSTPHTPQRWMGTLGVALFYVLRVYYVQGFYVVSYGLGIYVLNLLIGFLSPKIDPELESMDGASLPTKDSDEFKPFIRRLPEFRFWVAIGFYMSLKIFVGEEGISFCHGLCALTKNGHIFEKKNSVLACSKECWTLNDLWEMGRFMINTTMLLVHLIYGVYYIDSTLIAIILYSITKAFVVAFVLTFISVLDVPVFWPILLCYWIVLFVLTMKRQILHMIKYKYIPFDIGKRVITPARVFLEAAAVHLETKVAHPYSEQP
ncbi:unnamed protein product [Camellia sinensis]